MKVAHVVKRIEMIDDDIRQLKRLESQLSTNKKYSNPIIMSIEKQINLLLADRIKFLDLKIENPPAFMDVEEEKPDSSKETVKELPKVSRIRQRKKGSSKDTADTGPKKAREVATSFSAGKGPGTSDMLTQEMIDQKFEEARKKLLEESDTPADKKKNGISGLY
jgi:hypothetical protein